MCRECWEVHTPQEQKDKFFLKKEQRKTAERDWHRNNIERTIWKGAKHRAKKQGVPFNIEICDIDIPEYCPILGLKLAQSEGKTSGCSPSLDKIVPSKGYVKGNIQIISWKANSLKKDATLEELEKISDYIRKNS
jgi:hypothetical protein